MTIEDQSLAARIRRHLGAGTRVDRLAGDASDRAFYRLTGAGEGESLILMAQREPFHPSDSPFCQMQELLARIGLPVPEIRRLFPDEGWILMSDVGRTTLQEHLEEEGFQTAPEAYAQAVDLILTLQGSGTPGLSPDCHGVRHRLDREKLASELRFTWTHLLKGLWRLEPPAREVEILDRWADQLAARLEKTEQVLCHRDYHSRNLLWDGRNLAVVDFQDARLGPATYDLASLLEDPYVDLREDLKEELFWRFLEGRGYGACREGEIRDWLDLAVVQRCLKAAGTYAFQTTARHRAEFRRYVGPALRNALRALRRFREYDPAGRLLERYRQEAS